MRNIEKLYIPILENVLLVILGLAICIDQPQLIPIGVTLVILGSLVVSVCLTTLKEEKIARKKVDTLIHTLEENEALEKLINNQ